VCENTITSPAANLAAVCICDPITNDGWAFLPIDGVPPDEKEQGYCGRERLERVGEQKNRV
jgi:hypothetical protein